MKPLFVLGIFVALLFLIGCTENTIQTSPTPQENKVVDVQKIIPNKENPNLTKKEEYPVILKEEPLIATPPILTKQEPILPKESSLKENTLSFTSFIEESLDKYTSIETKIYQGINDFSSNKNTKEELCISLNSQKDASKELYLNFLERRYTNQMLFKIDLDNIKESVSENLKQFSGLLDKDVSSFCSSQGSILLLEKINDNLRTYSIRFRDTNFSLYKIKQRISKNPTTQTIAYLGDSIEKGGIKVTLNKVTKNYLSWQCSYNELRDRLRDSDVFTDEERKDIQKYQSSISSSSTLREQLIEELNKKYGNRVESEDLKFLYVDWSYEVTNQNLAKENLATRLRERKWALQEIYRSSGSVYTGTVGYNDINTISLYKENLPSFDPSEYYDCSYLGGTYFSNQELGGVNSGEIKVIIDFSSCVRNSAINIQHTEQGLICDNAYIFTVNLDD